ncbi:MAG: urease accessory protein UreE [Bacillota bacterium]|nr:urease accessory protein UreE [Bacillota bacterium]
MLVEEILGNIDDMDLENKQIDTVKIEWYEVDKKILKKTSRNGKDVGIRLKEHKKLNDGDILYMDDKEALVVDIPDSEALVVKANNMREMGEICYEIGNKHIPMFLIDNDIVVPFDEPLKKLLDKLGYNAEKENKKLVNGLECHGHSHSHDHE